VQIEPGTVAKLTSTPVAGAPRLVVVTRPPKDPTRRLSDLRGPYPMNAVRNLAEQLERSIETSARLRLFAAEATQDGLAETADAYDRLERLERRQIVELEVQLRRQLDSAIEVGREAQQRDEETVQ